MGQASEEQLGCLSCDRTFPASDLYGLKETRDWMQKYDFSHYVEEDDSASLLRLDEHYVWNHYSDGLNGEFARTGKVPDEYSEGYFVMNVPWDSAKGEDIYPTIVCYLQCDDHNWDGECNGCDEGEDGNHLIDFTGELS